MGPGYTPITYKLVTKITAGLFLDLAGLLPDNIRTQEIEPQAFLEGKLVVSGSKKRVIEIADIVTWIEAFTIFSMILCHTFPSRWKDLNQYKLLIIQTARRFSDKSWLHYHIAFRKEAVTASWKLDRKDQTSLCLKIASGGRSNSIVFQNSIWYINHSFSIPLQCPNYFINSADKTKFLHFTP